MPSLRERVREALARTEPGEREAHDELQTILARSRGEIRPWWHMPLSALTVGVVVVAAILVFVKTKSIPQSIPAPSEEAIHLYLHVDGEPVEKALTLDLATKRK